MKFSSWLLEGCRATQPLMPLAGSMIGDPLEITPGMIVTMSATIETPQGPVLIGAPVLTGRNNEASALLVDPDFG
jgi:hypothetical protein